MPYFLFPWFIFVYCIGTCIIIEYLINILFGKVYNNYHKKSMVEFRRKSERSYTFYNSHYLCKQCLLLLYTLYFYFINYCVTIQFVKMLLYVTEMFICLTLKTTKNYFILKAIDITSLYYNNIIINTEEYCTWS